MEMVDQLNRIEPERHSDQQDALAFVHVHRSNNRLLSLRQGLFELFPKETAVASLSWMQEDLHDQGEWKPPPWLVDWAEARMRESQSGLRQSISEMKM
jgi:hypothetical protein